MCNQPILFYASLKQRPVVGILPKPFHDTSSAILHTDDNIIMNLIHFMNMYVVKVFSADLEVKELIGFVKTMIFHLTPFWSKLVDQNKSLKKTRLSFHECNAPTGHFLRAFKTVAGLIASPFFNESF